MACETSIQLSEVVSVLILLPQLRRLRGVLMYHDFLAIFISNLDLCRDPNPKTVRLPLVFG